MSQATTTSTTTPVDTFAQAQVGRPTGPLIQGYEVIIGFETHTQLTTQSKIFSRASTSFGAEPNTNASAVDFALPGALPVMNKGAVQRAIEFGLAVKEVDARLKIFDCVVSCVWVSKPMMTS